MRDAAILTDGASVAVDAFGLFPDWASVLDAVRADGPHVLLSAVRHAEAADPEGCRWLRAKPHDDATVVYLDFGCGSTGSGH